jgi:hypothetical protein
MGSSLYRLVEKHSSTLPRLSMNGNFAMVSTLVPLALRHPEGNIEFFNSLFTFDIAASGIPALGRFFLFLRPA